MAHKEWCKIKQTISLSSDTWLVAWCSGKTPSQINEVTQHWAPLALILVTVYDLQTGKPSRYEASQLG